MEKYWKLLKNLMECPEVWPHTLNLRKVAYRKIGDYCNTGATWTENLFEQKLFHNPAINELLDLLDKDEKNGEFYWNLFSDFVEDSTKELLDICEEIKRKKE